MQRSSKHKKKKQTKIKNKCLRDEEEIDPVKVEIDPVKVEIDPVKVEIDPVKVEIEKTECVKDDNKMINKDKVSENKENLELLINNRCFAIALCEILKMSKNKLIELNNKGSKYVKLMNGCDRLINDFTKEESSPDRSRIIKGVYTSVIPYLEQIANDPDISIFSERNNTGQIITFIPAINIGLVIDKFSKDELERFWNLFYIVFISSARMISVINKHTRESDIWKFIDVLQEKIKKSKIFINEKIFNPYLEIKGGENINIKSIFTGIDEFKTLETDELIISTVSKLYGIGDGASFDDIKKSLNKELKGIDDEKMKEVKSKICDFLHIHKDGKTDKVYNTINVIADDITKELKSSGLSSVTGISKKVAKLVSGKLDQSEMNETAKYLHSFAKKSKDFVGKDPNLSNIISSLGGVSGLDLGSLGKQIKSIRKIGKKLGKK